MCLRKQDFIQGVATVSKFSEASKRRSLVDNASVTKIPDVVKIPTPRVEKVDDAVAADGASSTIVVVDHTPESTLSSEVSEEERKRLERIEKAQKMKLAIQVRAVGFSWLFFPFVSVL